MACCGCENYAKRISNVYRDEEIKEQFEMLIGYEVISDSFICDCCLTKLQDLIAFRDQCRRIHEKYHPDAKIRITEIPPESIDIIVEEVRNPEQSYDDIEHRNDEQNYVTEESQFSLIEHQSQSVPETTRRSKRKAKTEAEVQEPSLIEDKSDGTVMIFDPNDDENDESDILFEITEVKGKKSRKSWSQAQKLEIVEYAEKNSNRQAARHFQLNESTVRCFRRQKEQLMAMPSNRSTNRHGTVYWPTLENELKQWVNDQPSVPKITDIQTKAIEIAERMKIEKFTGSTSYIFKFMNRNGISSSSPRPRKYLKLEQIDESCVDENDEKEEVTSEK